MVELLLGFGEEGQLAKVEGHGADHGGVRAGPEPHYPFVLGYPGQGVEDGGVVCALGERLQAVGLHADEGQVRGVSGNGCEATCGETGGGALFEADGCAAVFCAGGEVLHEGVEEADAGGCVHGLTQEACAETRVQVHDSAGGYDVPKDADGRGFGPGFDPFAGKLEADLDHVHGLDDGGGRHAREAAVYKGQSSAHERRVQEVGGCFLGILGGFGHCGGGVGEDGF